MAGVLLDTTFFIDLHRRDARAESVWQRVVQGLLPASFSAITAFELWASSGITRSEEMFYQSAFHRLEFADLSASAAQQAAVWMRGMRKPVPEALSRDALIAAIAWERGETIYTRNVRDFRRFPVSLVAY